MMRHLALPIVGITGMLVVLGASAPALSTASVSDDGAPPKAVRAVEAPAAWVFFVDKGPLNPAPAIQELANTYNARAIARRQLRRTAPGLFDEHDLPVEQTYVDQVLATGATLRIKSRWLNAVSVMATAEQIKEIEALPVTRGTQPVARQRADHSTRAVEAHEGGIAGVSPYGFAEAQLGQINLDKLHAQGSTGEGVIIGVIDTGFNRDHDAFNHAAHPLIVVDEYDFVDDDANTAFEEGDPFTQHSHGTYILGTMAGYDPDTFLGAAYDAAFILCKTEDTTSETQIEEDFWVAAIEFIEKTGGDMVTSSLVYSDWYTQEDMDGLTGVTTVAVNIATDNGVYCCNAAGNAGFDADPRTSHLGAPADAIRGITVGAVDEFGEMAGFSSDGPTADGRVKPEVLARGVATVTVDAFSTSGYTLVDGTSLSTPLVAGAVACLVQAHPDWTVDEMREALFDTADYFGEFEDYDPLYVKGYGILDVTAASAHFDNAADLDGDGVVGAADLAILLGSWGPCPMGVGACTADLDPDREVGPADLAILLGAWG